MRLRFAGPASGSLPPSAGVPRRDVDGRVHIRVAGETAGSAPEYGLALTRVPVHLPARRATLARERGSDLLHPAWRLVLQQAHQQAPPRSQDLPVRAQLSAGRCGRDRPAFLSRNGVMFPICRSSTRIRSNRRATSVLAFSAQSLRRSVSRAFSRATACLTRPRRFEPRFARASVRCIRRSLVRYRAAMAGACNSSPVDRAAETDTPRSMPTA